jgi:hypothetical protein
MTMDVANPNARTADAGATDPNRSTSGTREGVRRQSYDTHDTEKRGCE